MCSSFFPADDLFLVLVSAPPHAHTHTDCQKYRSAQDKVICLLFQLMDEWRCLRADRDYRLKFPDDLVAGGENGESLNGQIWFGAECLASGSNIMNHEAESEMLRPMAKLLTNTLEQLRLELRHGVMDIDTSFFIFTHQSRISPALAERLQNFDVLFANFEYEYVKAMLPIKTADEIEKLHELTVLFSEAVAYSLKKELIAQQDIDECHPHVLIAIPRLAIVYGLVHCQESPIFRPQKDQLSKTFKDFHSVLHRVRELIATLHPHEVDVLQRMLTNEEEDSSSHRFVVQPKTSCSSSSNSVSPDAPHQTTSSTTPIPTSTQSSSPAVADTSNTRTSACVSPLVDDGRAIMYQNHVSPVCRYSHSYPQRGNPVSSFARNYQHRNEISAKSTCRLRGIRYHRRRHSDPVSGSIDKSISGFKKDTGSTMSLITTMKELRSRTAVMTLEPEVDDKRISSAADQQKECSDEPHKQQAEGEQECESASASNTRIERDDEEDEISSQTSITSSSCPSPSSADSFEMPVPAKSHISPGTRQLLQRLFVTISGIADQLQTNSAADLRVILRHVFQMYTVSSDSDNDDDDDSDHVNSDSDSLSVEEALEAREEADSSPPPSPSHSSSSSSSCTDSSSPAANAPTTTITATNVLVRGSASAEATAGSTHMAHLSPSSVSPFQSSVSMPQTSSAVTSDAIHNLLPESSSSGLTVTADRGMHVSQRLHESASTATTDCHIRRHPDHIRVKSHRRRVFSEGGDSSGSSRTLVPHSPDLLMLAPIWVPDELVASCTTCKQSFTILRRRHHCRNCGQIYCSTCSSHTMHLGQFGYTKPVRVCDPCFVTITTIHAYHSAHTDSSGNSGHAAVFQPQRSSSPTPGHN